MEGYCYAIVLQDGDVSVSIGQLGDCLLLEEVGNSSVAYIMAISCDQIAESSLFIKKRVENFSLGDGVGAVEHSEGVENIVKGVLISVVIC